MNDRTEAERIGALTVSDGPAVATAAITSPRTYADLIAYVAGRADLSLDGQQERNRASALQRFMEHLLLTPDSPVGPELGAGLDDALTAFVKAKKAEGLKDGSIANTRSAIRKWAKCWRELVESESEPKFETFHEALKYYVERKKAEGKLNLSDLARQAGMTRLTYISNTITQKKKTFEPWRIDAIASFEEALGAPATSLTRFTTVPIEALNVQVRAKRQSTEYGKKLAELQSDPYRIKDLPPQLLSEYRDFVKFKTAVRPPGNLVRNKRWRTKPIIESSAPQRATQMASVDGKTFSAGAIIFLGCIEQFFGIMALKGRDPEKFSLAWMLDASLLDEVIEFAAGRMGVVTENTISLLQQIRSLIYREGGWMYQLPEFSSKLYVPQEMNREEWEAFCNKRWEEINTVSQQLQDDGLVKVGRDTEEPIRSVLERDHPITALLDIVDAMERRLKKYESQPSVVRGTMKIVMQRDTLIFKVMIPQPLRVRMLKIMTWRKDNSGNLYRRSNGRWAIRFKKEDFKNETGAAKDKPYDVALPASLNAAIEDYLYNVRPQFNNPSDFVFVPDASKGKAKGNNGHTQGGTWLNDMIRARSAAFLKDCPGFGPHAIRHIVATDYIRNNPGSYIVAADILHDKLETVIKAYAHLKAADGHRVYQEYLATIERTRMEA